MGHARRGVLLALVLVTGCAGAGDERETPPAPSAQTATPEAPPPDPRGTLDAFIAAAAAEDAEGMWNLLTARARTRLGPSLDEFRAGAGARLAVRLAPFAGPGAGVVLSERVTRDIGVAAVTAPGVAFAAALRLADGEWSIELGGPIRIRALVPDPGETVGALAHVAAEFKAPVAIREAGLWMDGIQVPARAGGVSASYLTVFGEVGELERGAHSMVALVVAGAEVNALAWPFTAEPR